MVAEYVQTRQFAWVPPTTSAVTSKPFTAFDADAIVVYADHLTGGETVNILVVVGSNTLQVLLADMVTPATLTATLQGLVLEGGPAYVFDKSATSSSCGVYVDVKTAR